MIMLQDFMDSWTFNQKNLMKCCKEFLLPGGKQVPFCAYNTIGYYQIGHDTGLKEPDIKPARQDLWNFRWEHAQARIAARRGDQAEAQKHVAAAKAILDKGTNPEQAPFFPYLTGYVPFYAGDYKTALAELSKANPNDPFIQCMIGQTFEKLGDKDNALEYYRKAAISHNPPAAYAVPFAKEAVLIEFETPRQQEPSRYDR
jgi:tetratricopeptide (TPR) repeat protein